MKTKKIDWKRRYNNWLLDHVVLKYITEYLIGLIVSTVSAFLFAITMKIFVMPTCLINEGCMKIATGGASGMSQDIAMIFSLIFGSTKINEDLIYSILYFAVNIPLMVLAFFKIGKRFTLLSLINVAESSILVSLFSSHGFEWVDSIAIYVNENGGMLARSIFGGVCIGLSSALPYKLDFSAGGVDILSYVLSQKKGTQAGKYSVLINSFTIALFCILTAAQNGWGSETANSFTPVLYSILYCFVASLIIDAIHIRNKKCELKVVSEDKELADLLLTRIPHGATIVKGIGAYSGSDKIIISMVVSSNELSNIIKIIREEDPKSFIEVFELRKVLGSFYLKPIK